MPAPPSTDRNAERAVATYTALQQYFYQPEAKLYLEQFPRTGGNPFAFHWPFSQALAATVDLAGVPGIGSRYAAEVPDRLAGAEYYWETRTGPPAYASYVVPPRGQSGDKYYDDNEWTALELVQIHRVTGNVDALRRAQQIFDFVVSGWDGDPSHPAPGGVFWVQASWNRDRNTVSNAPGAELGLHLYELTGQRPYLEWAKRMYDWVNAYMLAPNGLYWDHVDLNGTVDRTLWSYNQGTMIGAGALFYRATREPAYLGRAERTADLALEHYGSANRFFNQDPPFNAIFFKNLLLLASVNGNRKYRDAMQSYADQAWNTVRDPATGLFRFGGAGPVKLLDQAALAQIYACLAWDPASYRNLA
ncbi:MAG: AGE family epimerase/isomerase [Chloroflexi bacterium]|nr:AGE family epimerase/isomerase [Chloroflexota bacterium]